MVVEGVVVIGVWQQDSGKGPQIGDGAAYCVPDLTPHAFPPLECIAGVPDRCTRHGAVK